MKINREWHQRNRMPENATLEQRIQWHLEHQRHCSCRGIPEKLKQEMTRRGIKWTGRPPQEE
ncbi:MAG TPA: hypothetical protein VF191_05490 [Cyclobacteriaceae bacterium]